jgi:hypothetical protein
MNIEQIQPLLIEPSVTMILKKSLKKCAYIKYKYYNNIYNIILFFGFCIFFSGILFYKYKGKLTFYEKQALELDKKNKILNKIKGIQKENEHVKHNLITNIPVW